MGLFGDNSKSAYDGAAAAYQAANGDMAKLSSDQRDKVNRLMNEAGARGNSVRATRDRR